MKAEMWNEQVWVEETDPLILKRVLGKLLKIADFEVLGFTDHNFKPQGYTALWLLGESHLAVHTFPEEGKSYIELSSCVFSNYLNFQSLLKSMFTL